MSWDVNSDGVRHPVRGPRRRGVPLIFRMIIAVVLAAALAFGTSYTLRTLNL